MKEKKRTKRMKEKNERKKYQKKTKRKRENREKFNDMFSSIILHCTHLTLIM
jgi:hypothetical protein